MNPNPTTPSLGSLNGLRVIDLSRVLGGPYCGQILADHGADVIKIEPPQGDETRTWGPPFEKGVASYYMGLNRNKRGVRMDLTQPTEREQLLKMLANADVLLENFKTGTLEKWGIGYETLKVQFPRLIHCRVSGYGADGPLGGLPGYDAAIQALSGIMSVNGEVGGEPLRVGLPVVDMVTGLNAALGVLMALQERQHSGKGQFVEASLYDCGLSLLHPHAANWFGDGRRPGRTGNAHPNIYPYDAFPTASVPIFLAVGNDRQFQQLCMTLGQASLAHDEAYSSAGGRSVNRASLREKLVALLASLEGVALVEQLSAMGVPCAPILDVTEALNHPHTKHREMTVSMPNGYRGIASPIKLSRTPATYRMPPPAES
ncbi:CaiB/BaiF CoA-transferase family protein [Limnohabitans sp. Hippo4]|uniref:CaiB/BaiF CoA transferase family protein n=1 Tax=Limnohabitans sp. Hippo4 TaxID=1826167 RepID=UPI000D3BB2D8|nr:CoA transferase [Limnohabitans sp. Hippo4]PUE36753.1 carnitine dehydratase [Limnohabitans sp. Hippo4]